MEDINIWESKLEGCVYSDRLLNKIVELNKLVKKPVELWEVKKACYYARKYHGPQMRQSGEPYYSHPIEVAYMFSNYTAHSAQELFQTELVQVSILHDTIEDTLLTKSGIITIFNKKVAALVDDLTRIKDCGKISSAEMLDSLILQKKYEAALVKIFDRFHNIKTISAKSPEKAKKIIEETFDYFIILAEYLQLKNITEELKEICYQYLGINSSPAHDHSKVLVGNPLTLSPVFQNEVHRMQIQYLLES